MNWQHWALTHENCFCALGTPRMDFICSNRGETEYAAEFPKSAFGYTYTPTEQRWQWRVILEARRWLEALYMVENGLAPALNAALTILEARK